MSDVVQRGGPVGAGPADGGPLDGGHGERGGAGGIGGSAGARPARRRRSAAPHALPALSTGSYLLPEPGAGARSRRWLVVVLPAVVGAVLVARWTVAAGAPPLVLDDLRAELWSTWSYRLSGAGSTSYPMARALDAGVALVAGTGARATPSLTALSAAYAAAATAWLARSLLLRPMATLFAGLLAVVNPVVLWTLPDPVPLLAVGVASTIAALLRAATRVDRAGQAVRAGRADRAGGAGGTADVGVAPGAPFGSGAARGRPVPLAVALLSLPLSALAAEPLLLAGLAVAAPPVAGAFAVVEGRASVGRLLRFLAWALPLGVVASLWWLVPAVLTWSPWREGIDLRPGGLATAHLVALVVPLGALGAAAVVDRRLARSEVLRRTGHRRGRVVAADVVTAVGAVAVLAVPFPLWTAAVSGDTGELAVGPGIRVGSDSASGAAGATPAMAATAGSAATPDDAWPDLAAAVDGSPVAGKVLLLPLADVATDGDGPARLLRRPVLQRPTDPLFRLPAAVDALLRRAERLAAAGDAEELALVLDDLGVSHLVITDRAPDEVRATAARLRGWRPAGRFGVADVVERVRTAPLLDAVAAEPDGTPPRIAWARHAAGHYEVDVVAAPGAGPFVLRLAETYGPGWTVEGLPGSWSARHGLVAGYANGWRIEGEGRATLHLRHQPTRWSAWAAYASLAALAVAALVTAAPYLRRFDDATPAAPPGDGSEHPRRP
ncbi:MAG TPA: hypothetical protein VIL36_11710 [Acidimicrobiales bacterium]